MRSACTIFKDKTGPPRCGSWGAVADDIAGLPCSVSGRPSIPFCSSSSLICTCVSHGEPADKLSPSASPNSRCVSGMALGTVRTSGYTFRNKLDSDFKSCAVFVQFAPQMCHSAQAQEVGSYADKQNTLQHQFWLHIPSCTAPIPALQSRSMLRGRSAIQTRPLPYRTYQRKGVDMWRPQ